MDKPIISFSCIAEFFDLYNVKIFVINGEDLIVNRALLAVFCLMCLHLSVYGFWPIHS